ncbi:energy-coupling factor transporter transmembrane component T [Paenibacillus sp. 1P07SE]|uniref:energy-coupling factor transporter transmembrane component T n=1 Tax=Paenibacillus sp. 1P07SE TaxID=3132209 RepID=UPI0039A78296
MFLLIFIFFFHLLVEDGGSRYLQLGTFAFYTGGLERGVVAASRMILFIIYAAMLTFTTQPDRLAQGLSSVLTPLSLLGVPIPRLTLMLGIALRFVPTLFEEAERLWKAQVSRGLDLRRQPLASRARLLAALLIPVSTGAFRRAMALADAMESRGYRLDMARTVYRSLGWQAADSWFLVLFALPVTAAAML